MTLPKFVSYVALGLGAFDILRGVSLTVPVGLDTVGATQGDQLTHMVALGASNFITGAMLIFLALRDRVGALLMLALIPVSYFCALLALEIGGLNFMGQGTFPGRYVMSIYLSIAIATVGAALVLRPSAPREAPL